MDPLIWALLELKRLNFLFYFLLMLKINEVFQFIPERSDGRIIIAFMDIHAFFISTTPNLASILYTISSISSLNYNHKFGSQFDSLGSAVVIQTEAVDLCNLPNAPKQHRLSYIFQSINQPINKMIFFWNTITLIIITS